MQAKKVQYMSYMRGPHMPAALIVFNDGPADNCFREKPMAAPPAWLVADWMLAEKRGEPLATEQKKHVDQARLQSLCWLRDYLSS